MVTEDTCVYGITWERKQNKKRSPRADPQGILTFKGLAQEDDPAKKEQLEQNEARGSLEAKVVGETLLGSRDCHCFISQQQWVKLLSQETELLTRS